jgi:glucokinase
VYVAQGHPWLSEPCYIGVDLGGTQLRVAAVTAAGTLASEMLSVPTGREFGPDDLRVRLSDLGRRVRENAVGRDIKGLGFGTAGVIRPGPLTQSDNLPRLNGVDVHALVGDVAGCPVRLENDARCFTLAEARYGAGRGEKNLCGIVLGTGVGCGILVEGRLLRGVHAQAGEVWRIPYRGAPIEHAISGAGIVRAYEAAGGRNASDAATVASRARAGDAAAAAAWRGFGEDLAFLCECLESFVDPALIVIGGSVAQSRDLFSSILEQRLAGRAARIAFAELGPAAGVIGAAALNIP